MRSVLYLFLFLILNIQSNYAFDLDLNEKLDTIKNKKQESLIPDNFFPLRYSPAMNPPGANGIEFINDESGMYANIDTVKIIDTTSAESKAKYQLYKKSMHYMSKGVVQLNLKDYKKAVKNLKKSLSYDKENSDAKLLLANAYSELDLYSKSIRILNKEVKENDGQPNDKQAVELYNRGIVLTKLGKHENSLEDFTKAIQLKSDYYLAYMGRASARTITKDYVGAIEDYSVILETNKYQIQARRARAVCYTLMQYWDMAEYDLKFILEHLPKDGLSYYYLGLVNVKQNSMVKACNNFSLAVQLDIQEAKDALKAYCK